MIYGHEVPRIYTPPLRDLNEETTLGYALIEFAEDILQVDLLPWQKWLAIHALELREDGGFRFRTVVVLIARQNGKSMFGIVLSLFFMYVLNVPLVVGTAQSLELAEEVWDGAVEMAESIPELAEKIEKVSHRNGGKALKLQGGERYKIAAATRKGGRGLSSDLILLDELREHTNWDAWGAVTKSAMARPEAITWCMSNAGDSQSVVLKHLRVQAHKKIGDPDGIAAAMEDLIAQPEEHDYQDDDTLAIFEWSAEKDLPTNSRLGWQQANPSLGYGFMTERALASACASDPDPVFRTECLCQWVEATIIAPFPHESWQAGVDEESEIALDNEVFYGIDMNEDRSTTSIAVCGRREDGLYHTEVIASRTGFDWALQWLQKQKGIKLACQGRGAPIAAYIPALEELKGVELIRCEGRDLGAWTGRFFDSVTACLQDSDSDAVPVYHRTQPLLDNAAAIAQKKYLGDGAFCWDRRKSIRDVAPLIACTMAYGLATGGSTENKYYQSAYAQEREILFV